jgi:hypothetical protein
MGEMINAHKISVGKPEGKSQLGRPRRKWERVILKLISGSIKIRECLD